MPRRGENIHRRHDGRWEGRFLDYYTSKGKAHYKSVYDGSYAGVKAKLKSIQAEHTRPALQNIGIETICFEWLDHKKLLLKESSYSKYYDTICNHIIPFFKHAEINAITLEMLNGFVANLYYHGRVDKLGGLSAKTIRDIIAVLRQLLKYVKQKQHLERFCFDAFQMPKVQQCESNILSVSEHAKLISYIQSNLTMSNVGVLLALYTGVRLGELCALSWDDIDFELGTLRITKTLQRIKNVDAIISTKTKIVIGQPKSQKSIRTIPIPTFLLALLIQYKPIKSGFCFLLTGTAKYIEPRTYQTRYATLLKKANLRYVNFHILRHTFASMAIEVGFDMKSLSEILGHSSVRFTLDRYVHSSHAQKRNCMEKMKHFY